jgi:CRP/FNR family transcriptional regulator, cyclic AMP receptor protein
VAHATTDFVLRTSPLLGGLDEGQLSVIFAAARPLARSRGENVLRAEDDYAVLLLSGTVEAAVVGRDGVPVTVDFLGPGDVAGLPVVMGQPHAGVRLTALTTVRGLLLRGMELRDLIGSDPGLATACLRAVTAELATARDDLARHADTSTRERIVDRLLQLADRWGESIDGCVHISVPLTQEMLASWSRSSRESAAKALHDLRANGLIRTGRRDLTILDIERLSQRRANARSSTDRTLRYLMGSLTR